MSHCLRHGTSLICASVCKLHVFETRQRHIFVFCCFAFFFLLSRRIFSFCYHQSLRIAYVLMSILECSTLSYWEITGVGNVKQEKIPGKVNKSGFFSVWATQQLTHCTSVYSFNYYNRMIDDTYPSTIECWPKFDFYFIWLVLFVLEKWIVGK